MRRAYEKAPEEVKHLFLTTDPPGKNVSSSLTTAVIACKGCGTLTVKEASGLCTHCQSGQCQSCWWNVGPARLVKGKCDGCRGKGGGYYVSASSPSVPGGYWPLLDSEQVRKAYEVITGSVPGVQLTIDDEPGSIGRHPWQDELEALLMPFGIVEGVIPDGSVPGRATALLMLKPSASLNPDKSSEFQIRMDLYLQAELACQAVEARGYRHIQPPAIDLRGKYENKRFALDGESSASMYLRKAKPRKAKTSE